MLGAPLLTLTPGAIEKPADARVQSDVVERGTLRLHYVQKPIGYERYQIGRQGDTLTLTSDFDFTDRGGRVQLAATLRTQTDFTPDLVQGDGQELSLRQRRFRGPHRGQGRGCQGGWRRVARADGRAVLHRRRVCAVRGADAAAALLEEPRPAACHPDRPRAPDERRLHRGSRDAKRFASARPRSGSNATSSTASSGAARRSGSTIAVGSPPRSRAPEG